MIRYFYDKTAAAVIRLDEEKMILEQLPELSLPLNTPSPADVSEILAAPAAASTERAKRNAGTPKRKPGCDECGSPGRHKSSCSKSGSAKKPVPTSEWDALGEDEPAKRMSRMTFGRVKISQHNDIPVDVIARNMDEPVDEIEKAFEVDTYDEYSKL
jgi:hypothetical protein